MVEAESEDEADVAYFVRKFVFPRSPDSGSAARVLDYLDRVAKLGTVIQAGTSEKADDGSSPYPDGA